ncbi:hypothetical protein HDV03_002426 [Kappamyces sp. JEL0829]|nr:hypothetical protein HDV03_002426 [Kappamyces sp. JEL0829]
MSLPDRNSISQDVEAFLRKEKKEWEKLKSEPKLLLLGSSDSGKSTLLKQLKIMHSKGFSDQERELSRRRIIGGVLKSIEILVNSIESFEHTSTKSKYMPLLEWYSEWHQEEIAIPEAIKAQTVEAWSEPIIQQIFMEHINRICAPQYVPTNDDILNLRTITQSVTDTIFPVDGQRLHVIDVSGLSHHRNGWVSYFDDVKAILFVASLSCYDQTMMEEEGVNRMVDSVVLFENMVNHELLRDKYFILFLNKKDLYGKKIKKKDIADYFPNYKGKKGSVSQGIKYFEAKFKDQNRYSKEIVTHVTCCTDSKIMRVICANMISSIISGQLKNLGLQM